MKNKELLLILDSEGKYRQKIDQYQGIEIDIFIKELKNLGYEIEITNYFEVAKKIDQIKNKQIIYTSHQQLDYKKYIEDIMICLNEDNVIIPGINSLIGHENKGYQELQRKKLGLDKLESYVISHIIDLEKIEITYPIVLKRPNSCSSRGVFLAHNEKELDAIIKKYFLKKDFNYYQLKLKKIMKKLLKKNTLNWTDGKIKDYRYSRFILEQFIPNLDGDYKILIYGNKYYGLKRGVKKGDFKASGSGIHDYHQEIPEEVLTFAKECFNKLDIPFAGFDIAIDENKKCYMIEYQSLHIGPVTLMHSEKYYTYDENKWHRHNEKSVLELEYARAIDWYLENRK